MPECENCGGHVSKDFARVMGDNRGRIHACPSCAANALGSEAGGVKSSDL